MSETFPRWGLPAVNFVETDAAKIQSAILTGYESVTGRSLASGDPVRLFLLSIADVIIQQRGCINTAAQQNLLSYATGEYLDAMGVFLSVLRHEASYAVTTIRFKLSQALANAYTIPVGFGVTNGVVTFVLEEELVIPPGELYAEASAVCTTVGEAGNDYLAGQISTIVVPMTFLESAVNITTSSGGADAESDAEYAERIRMAPNSFSVAGPEKAYVYHTYSVSPAIVDVAVTSPEPGEVHVYPLMDGGELPSETILTQIDAHLSSDTIRPLTDHVSVLAPKAREYEINVDYWILEGDKGKAETIRANVEKAVEDYRLWQQSSIGRDITPAKLIYGVVGAGASRIDSATMLPAAFEELAKDEVAQCTKVTVTYKGYKAE